MNNQEQAIKDNYIRILFRPLNEYIKGIRGPQK